VNQGMVEISHPPHTSDSKLFSIPSNESTLKGKTFYNVEGIKKNLLPLPRWHYSPMRTFASLMALSQSALFFDLSFPLLILHFLMSVCTQFHHLFLGRPLGRLPRVLLLDT
jgi:hypothetical protein